MGDPYAFARGRVAKQLARRKNCIVTLTRATRAAPDPETPYIPGAPTLSIYDLDAYVTGVAAQYVDGTTILVSDLMVVVSPRARLAGADVDVVPQMDDVLTIDGRQYAIKAIKPAPAAGPAAIFRIFVAS